LWNSLPGRTGAFWILIALALPRLGGAIFTVVLRRILGPGASGTFDLAYAPYRFLDNFRNFGTGPALIYERTVSRATANTAWTLNMLAAVLITAVAQVVAQPIANFYGHPAVAGVFRLLSIAYVFSSMVSVHAFLLLRDMDYRARSVPAVGQVIAAGAVASLFAVWGFGVGALVARELASAVVGAILLWAIYPFRPRLQLVPELASNLIRYGFWVGAGLTLLYLSQNADVFIGGHYIRSKSDIGFYTTSWRLAFIAAGVFTVAVSSVVFPALSRIQDDRAMLRAKLLRATRHLGLVMFPASALLAALAPVVIVPLLGETWSRYRASFMVLTLLAIYAGVRTTLFVFFEAYKSVGKPWLFPVYNAIKLAVIVPAMIVGAQHGILGLAFTYIPIQAVEIPTSLYLVHRVLGISPLALWRASWVPLVSTLVMAGAAVGVEVLFLARLHAGDTATLAVCIAIAATTYVGSLLFLDRNILLENRAVLLEGL
jgi:O-antigen/teichoic acid export membrane protein